ncbi:MAG: hypothetical protein AMJ38_00175 [Dehalococcoidia bacterium DG_22]|nr:MAG: hypothetical protein AMJ38_00175 [Dehalococcoidia bacterium DG_22]
MLVSGSSALTASPEDRIAKVPPARGKKLNAVSATPVPSASLVSRDAETMSPAGTFMASASAAAVDGEVIPGWAPARSVPEKTATANTADISSVSLAYVRIAAPPSPKQIAATSRSLQRPLPTPGYHRPGSPYALRCTPANTSGAGRASLHVTMALSILSP